MQFFKKIKNFFIIILIFFLYQQGKSFSFEKIDFWDDQVRKKGANVFNKEITAEILQEAKKNHIKFIRMSIDKFPSSNRDFLFGDVDHFESLDPHDLIHLKSILDLFEKEKMPVIITVLSLPGSRWLQNNNFKDDLRIWGESKYLNQSIVFWKNLAYELKDYDMIVGYNILNEPHPEKNPNFDQSKISEILYHFYDQIIKGIRLVDQKTPIIIDSSAYADPKTFDFLKPHSDNKILYSFHIYEPYEYTNYKKNQEKYEYPGIINGKHWDQFALEEYMKSVSSFQEKYKISSNRILVGEFGGNRFVPKIENYFKDLLEIFKKNKWHYAFYSFMEDTWDGMDYELGAKKLNYKYWDFEKDCQKGDLNSCDEMKNIIKKAKSDKENSSIFSVLQNDLFDTQ